MRRGQGDNTDRTPARLEGLEARSLMSATPLAVSTVSYLGGTQLKIIGTGGADQITVKKTSAGMLITNTGGWSQTIGGPFNSILVDGGAGNDSIVFDSTVTQSAILYGSNGSDTLVGGNAADRLFGGGGSDKCTGGAGDDTLVGGVGDGGLDTCTGGTGNDNFWVDSNESITDIAASETTSGLVHRISSFSYGNTAAQTTTGTSKTPTVKDLADPVLTSSSLGYRNFSTSPLFASAGPSAADIRQGAVGDCYFLSTLSSIAKVDPQLIKQSVTELGDGTYAVQFVRNNVKQFIHVDADLATYSSGSLAYARLGAQGSVWVAILEKAFTFFRSGAGTYASIASGWMSEVYSDFGKSCSSYYSASSSSWLMNLIKSELDAGKSVTYAVRTAGTAPLISSHAYMVDSVVTDDTGKVTGLRLRNPWGYDGAGSDGNSNDGYVTITPEQAQACMLGMSSAFV